MAATVFPYIYWFEQLSMAHLPQVGGKNASLGEMVSQLTAAGVDVPGGFATSAQAFVDFLQQDNLGQRITDRMVSVDVNDVSALQQAGSEIRQWIEKTPLLPALEEDVRKAWHQLQGNEQFSVAVRSSATAEDLPDASFAGQQETYLNVQGIDQVLEAIKKVYASLYTDRAIAYRVHHGFEHSEVSISAGIQRMARSDKGTSGVMFTLDTESGFRDVVFITASYGLGEMVVQGGVNPDEFYLHKRALKEGYFPILRRNQGTKAKRMVFGEGNSLGNAVMIENVPEIEQNQFCINDEDLKTLGNLALIIEDHYGRPMDIEWAKESHSGKIFILQARPETVRSSDKALVIERFQLEEQGEVLTQGRSIGQRLGQGKACIIHSLAEMDAMPQGAVLVTDMTDPDWEPVMKRAAAIVTNRGGRTCHAAIIARELGIPAVVGTGDGTEVITSGQEITVSCAEGDTGFVYAGLLKYQRKIVNVEAMPAIPFKMMMNVANPDRAFAFQRLPNEGIGLARLEFIISQMIGIHPQALLDFNTLEDDTLKNAIAKRTAAYPSPVDYYVHRLAEGMSTLAAAFYPKPVIVRLSDFKSNEYAHLLGGDRYEPEEENPMLGFRGASRYVSSQFGACFELECRAVKKVREDMGLTNMAIMIPFVRTVSEAKAVMELLAQQGLKRGEQGLKVMMMCELPSNALLAEDFLPYFDGFSIGSNDLTQLTLGLDRDSGLVAKAFDERNDAVKILLSKAITACKAANKYIGICGQGPSDHPDLAKWLMEQGIESMSLNPDTVLDTWLFLAKK